METVAAPLPYFSQMCVYVHERHIHSHKGFFIVEVACCVL